MLRDILYRTDIESVLLGLAFVLILAIVLFVLGRFPRFQKNPAIKTVIGFCVSMLTVYGIARTSISLENLFYNLGFTQDLLYNVILVVIIGFFIVAGYARKIRKWRLYRPLIVIGFMFTVAAFTPIIYEKSTTLTISVPILILGIFLWWRRWRWSAGNRKEKEYSELKTRKRAADYEMRLAEKAARKAKKKDNLEETKTDRKQRQQRLRSARELNAKYQQYSGAIQYLQKKNNGKIPALGTSDGNLRHRYIQAMKAIENLARDQGIKLNPVKRI